MNQTYVDTVRLLLAVAPQVFASGRLGLKAYPAARRGHRRHWELMSFKQLPDLSAVRWTLQNIEKLKIRNKRQLADQHDQLLAL
jgi:hypothetical protein